MPVCASTPVQVDPLCKAPGPLDRFTCCLSEHAPEPLDPVCKQAPEPLDPVYVRFVYNKQAPHFAHRASRPQNPSTPWAPEPLDPVCTTGPERLDPAYARVCVQAGPEHFDPVWGGPQNPSAHPCARPCVSAGPRTQRPCLQAGPSTPSCAWVNGKARVSVWVCMCG